MKKLVAVAALVSALALPAFAAEVKVGDITVDAVWSRATAPRAPAGAVYLVLNNHGGAADTLVAVSSPAAERAQLHTHQMDDGVMKMRPIEAIEVAPGTPSVLAPGGLHIMLIGLKSPLQEGAMIPVVLTFEQAGEVEVMSHIQSAGAMDAGGAVGHRHGDAPMTN